MKLGELIGNLSVIIFFANIVLAFVIIFLSRKNPGATWAWVLVLMFIPILGFFLYLFLGQDAQHIQTFTKKNDEDEKN